MAWQVDGPTILAQAGKASPSTADSDWADSCAAAVNAAVQTRLRGTVVDPGSALEAELTRAAILDGVGAFVDRASPQGILSIGPDGQPARLDPNLLRASMPVLRRYTVPGIG